MNKWRIEFTDEYTPSPLSFWVHKHLDSALWQLATKYDPSLPKAVPNKGFPVLRVDAFGTELQFSSVEETEHFLEVIGQKNMPTSSQLSKKRNANYGPNGHWLSRLPSKLKAWTKRQKIIPTIRDGLKALKAVYE